MQPMRISMGVCMGYLALLSFMDLKNGRISIYWLAAGVGMAAAYQTIWGSLPSSLSLLGAAVGLVFIGIAKGTGESFGYGDGIVITGLGIYIGVWEILWLLMIAFFLAAGMSAFLMIRKHFRRKETLPFLPFMEIAYIGMVLLGEWPC